MDKNRVVIEDSSQGQNISGKKKQKKHRLLKVVLILFLTMVVFFFLICMIPDEYYVDDGNPFNYDANSLTWEYSDDYQPTKLTALVDELSQGGESLCADYEGGENGIWGSKGSKVGLRKPASDVSKAETVTWMVYIIGADLESQSGVASYDLNGMIDSRNGENLNIVVETGGASEWQNEYVDANTRQRWLIQDSDMYLCEDIGQGSMCTSDSLSDFIKWSAQTYPADRYIISLCDHGGGTLGGFGRDENYEEDYPLSLPALSKAFEDGGVKFDIIAYDACLMGTLEIAYDMYPYADYMLASEESLNSGAFCYAAAMSELSDRPNMSSLELGARMIDDFAAYDESGDMTLSFVDLREVPALYDAYQKYYQNAEKLLDEKKFAEFSAARSTCRTYGNGDKDQIDLVDFVKRTNVPGTDDVVKALFKAVKYRNVSSLTGSYGLAIYSPYIHPEYYQVEMDELSEIGFVGIDGFYNTLLSIVAASTEGSSNSVSDNQSEESADDISGQDWYERDAADDYDFTTISDASELKIENNGEDNTYILSLPEDEWPSITEIRSYRIYDDGDKFVYLGEEQKYHRTSDGNVEMNFEKSWKSVDGSLVTYYANEPEINEDVTVFSGRIPARLNDEDNISIIVKETVYSDGESTSKILGYYPDDSDNVIPNGYFRLKKGDVVQFTYSDR